MAWNNEDLRAWMIKADFPGCEDCGHFGTVIYNGAFKIRARHGLSR